MQLTKNEYEQINAAVRSISHGVCKRVDISSTIKVYEVKNVIRIDIKMEEQK